MSHNLTVLNDLNGLFNFSYCIRTYNLQNIDVNMVSASDLLFTLRMPYMDTAYGRTV